MKIFSGKLKRVGSMQLSINAIVVLVLAITMLGLGIAFTKKMFNKFGQTLYVPEPDLPASADEPIVTPSGDEITIQKAKDTALTIKIYNAYDGGVMTPVLDCDGTQIPGTPQSVDSGTDKKFKIIIPQNTFSQEGLMPCTIAVVHEAYDIIASTQIVFNIR